VEESFEHGNEPSGSVKCWEVFLIESFITRTDSITHLEVYLDSRLNFRIHVNYIFIVY
jgi:hypothetical protein